MRTVATRRLIIEVEVDSEPISGRILIDPDPERTFVGWTALAGLIEAEHRHTGDELTGRSRSDRSQLRRYETAID
jgi:hypothetical protein